MSRYAYGVLITAFIIIGMTATVFGQDKNEEAHKYMIRGMAAIEMAKSEQDLAKAVVEFKKATEVAPDMAAAWNNLGSVQTKIGQIKQAIESYRRYLALAPQAEDAARVSDEIIKLEYRLEQAESFQSLSGYWISEAGEFYRIQADHGTLILKGTYSARPGAAIDYKFDGESKAWPIRHSLVAGLSQNGDKWIGFWEIPEFGFPTACSIPAHKAQVEAVLNEAEGRINVKITRPKYRVNVGYDWGSSRCRCNGVSLVGMIQEEEVLSGPLPNGITGCKVYSNASGNLNVQKIAAGLPAEQAGLKIGDEIIAIDGTELTLIKTNGEKIRKLLGQPGSTVHLVVKRTIKKDGLFSSPKIEKINITIQRISPDSSVIK